MAARPGPRVKLRAKEHCEQAETRPPPRWPAGGASAREATNAPNSVSRRCCCDTASSLASGRQACPATRCRRFSGPGSGGRGTRRTATQMPAGQGNMRTPGFGQIARTSVRLGDCGWKCLPEISADARTMVSQNRRYQLRTGDRSQPFQDGLEPRVPGRLSPPPHVETAPSDGAQGRGALPPSHGVRPSRLGACLPTCAARGRRCEGDADGLHWPVLPDGVRL